MKVGRGIKVSVLTPVWNEERYLPAMLESMLAQTYTDWELLLVDDGSTDTTVSIIRSLLARDTRIKLVHYGEKLGKVAAFNRAFSASTGDIVCHVGGDDLARPQAMQARVDALGSFIHDHGAAFFKFSMFSDDPAQGKVLPRGRLGSRSGPSTSLTRPLAQVVFPIPESLPSEDLWIGEASFALANHVIHSPAVVVDYRVHSGNSNPRNHSHIEMSAAIRRRMQFIPALLAEERFTLPASSRDALALQWKAEQLRVAGRPLSILRTRLSLIDRLATASMSRPLLWRLRQLGAARLSGWRQR